MGWSARIDAKVRVLEAAHNTREGETTMMKRFFRWLPGSSPGITGSGRTRAPETEFAQSRGYTGSRIRVYQYTFQIYGLTAGSTSK